jgi:tRNA (adenine37-N6)-methyltransferase
MEKAVEIKPIATFRTRKKNAYEAARQGAADHSDELGEIHFESQQNFEQALEGIEGFSHLWIVYQFHHNPNWKPMVSPPRGTEKKIGVLATRSPHRPNALGLSCVELVERNGLVLKVKNFDLLDQTPVFDIKPYLPYADSVPDAKLGWLENIETQKHRVQFSKLAEAQIQDLKEMGVSELRNFLLQQLQFDPLNTKKKRVRVISETHAVLAYRTWRAWFSREGSEILVEKLTSGYKTGDLGGQSEDPYHDKENHRQFLSRYPAD